MTRCVHCHHICIHFAYDTCFFAKSLNLVECPEFRRLLVLLRDDLKETMIPRRTKLRELIVRAWKQYFQVLRSDLKARLPYFIHYMCLNFPSRLPWAGFPSHWTYGRIKISVLI
jgi:hypothetical protein